jgi:hypothetical protein
MLINCIKILLAMSKSETEGMDKEDGSQVQLVVYRVPKKNHDVMVQICKQSNDMFRKYGVLHYEIFQLDNTKSFGEMGMTNILPNYFDSPGRGGLGGICILEIANTWKKS